MLTFFRRALSSWIVVGLLAVVMLAFIVTGVGTPGGLGNLAGGPGANMVATVGGEQVPAEDVARRAQLQLQQARQQQPDLDMASFVKLSGGVQAIVQQYLTGRMLEVWARKHGITASDRLIDGEIASIPAFQGPTGQIDERAMQAILAQQHMTLAGLRDGMRGDLIRRQLLVPLGAAIKPPTGLIEPYARLFTNQRQGLIGLVPARPDQVPAPTDADIAAWYKAHIARYSLPERRAIRYAPVGLDDVSVPAPTDAEIAAQYQKDAGKYQASETRTLSQVILPAEAAAKALEAKVAGGTPFAKAAADAGFQAADIALGKLAKPDFARIANPAIADAAFAAKQGATLPPMKSSLGWHVVHIDAIEKVPARSLAEVRPSIADALIRQRKIDALSNLGQKMQDALDDGSTFDEVVKANRLKVVTPPPVTAQGAAPSDPAFKPDQVLSVLIKPAFDGSPDDEPTIEQVGPDQHFALLKLDRVLPPAPIPLKDVHDRAAADLRADLANKQAEATAKALLAKVDGGTPIGDAFAAAKLPAPQPIKVTQLELMRTAQVPSPIRGLFSLAPGHAKLVQAPGGWFVVRLDAIRPGPADMLPALAAPMKNELTKTLGDEYLDEFANAARAEVKIRLNPKAIEALGRELGGQATADGQ